jgi:hypothetical protein
MRKNFFYSTTVLFIASIFVLTSCDNLKENELSLSNLDVELAEDAAVAEDVFSTLDAMVSDEVITLDENNYSSSVELKSAGSDSIFPCKVVTVDYPNDTTRFPKVITIDYGEGCTTVINDAAYTRKGIIQITISGRCHTVGSTRVTTFIDFSINDIGIEGTRTVTNLGENADGNFEQRHELVDGKLNFGDTMQYTRNSLCVRERVRGETRMDDTLYINGQGDGTNIEGNEYQFQITERLMLIRCEAFRHQWAIVGGVIETTTNGETTIVDYGDGNCDDTAIIWIDGNRGEFKVHHRYNNRRVTKGN